MDTRPFTIQVKHCVEQCWTYLQRESLEHKIHDHEKEMCKLRTERDEATRSHSNMESKVADLQVNLRGCIFLA